MRLIDADEIIIPCMETTTDDYRVQSMIDEQPTVDAVPVIRCRDCKHHKGYNCDRLYGMQDAFMAKDDDYCSKAERRDDD